MLSLVATENSGKIVGFIASDIAKEGTDLLKLAVIPGLRRNRIGTMLLEETKIMVQESIDCHTITTWVFASDEASNGFLRSSGFKAGGWSRKEEDDLVLFTLSWKRAMV